MNRSVKTTARTGGLLYLFVILGGIFAEIVVRGSIVVHGDAVATARNIIEHETLYRWGFAVEVLYCACNVPLAIVFYRLFKPVNPAVTMLAIIFSIIGTAVEAICLLAHFAPLVVLDSSQQLHGFTTEQLQSWAYLSLRFFNYGYNIALVFFGFFCVSMSYLVFRSTFLPKLIGIFLLIQGLCYLTSSFINFLAPAFASVFFPFLAASGIGEISFCLWLLIAGVNTWKWQEKKNAVGQSSQN